MIMMLFDDDDDDVHFSSWHPEFAHANMCNTTYIEISSLLSCKHHPCERHHTPPTHMYYRWIFSSTTRAYNNKTLFLYVNNMKPNSYKIRANAPRIEKLLFVIELCWINFAWAHLRRFDSRFNTARRKNNDTLILATSLYERGEALLAFLYKITIQYSRIILQGCSALQSCFISRYRFRAVLLNVYKYVKILKSWFELCHASL